MEQSSHLKDVSASSKRPKKIQLKPKGDHSLKGVHALSKRFKEIGLQPKGDQSYWDEVRDIPYAEIIAELYDLRYKCRAGEDKISLPNTKGVAFSKEKGYLVCYQQMKTLQKKTVSFLFRLLNVVISKLEELEGNHCLLRYSIRDIYCYMINDEDDKRRTKIGRISRMIDDLCCHYRCTRQSLGIASEFHGFYAGSILVTRGDSSSVEEVIEDGSALVQAFPINYNNIKSIRIHPRKPRPRCILVVEKLTVLYEIISHKLHEKSACIVITGMGQPSQECRQFVKRVSETLEIPTFALVDMNASGYDIYKNYKYGSKTLAFMNASLAVPNMRILGIFYSDWEDLDLENTKLKKSFYDAMQSITDRDRSLIKGHLKARWMHLEPKEVKDSLKFMLDERRMADIEIIAVFKSYKFFVNTFLRRKIDESLGSLS